MVQGGTADAVRWFSRGDGVQACKTPGYSLPVADATVGRMCTLVAESHQSFEIEFGIRDSFSGSAGKRSAGTVAGEAGRDRVIALLQRPCSLIARDPALPRCA